MQLEIIISYKNRVVGKCEHLKLKKHAPESARDLKLKKVVVSESITIDYHETLSFEILYINKFEIKLSLLNFTFRLIDGVKLENKDVSLYGHFCPIDSLDVYDQYLFDVVKLWSKNKDIKWKKINDKMKESYLRACGLWSGRPVTMNVNNAIEIDGTLIRSSYDLYYYLAIQMLDEKGFVGMSLDSFEDCLIELNNNNQLSNFSFVFHNCKVLKKNIGDDYFEMLLGILRRFTINVSCHELA